MKAVFDTVTFWSCDKLLGAPYADLRMTECVCRVLEHSIDPACTSTFILPKAAESSDTWRSAGPLPATFVAFLEAGLLVEPTVPWSAEPESDEDVLNQRLEHFEGFVRADPASIGAFARLHTHQQVGQGWLRRVDDYVTPKPLVYLPPSDPDDRRLGIPKHLVDYLEKDPVKRSDRFREFAETVGVSPWQLRFAFSVLNRGGEYDGSISRRGNDEWLYVTHPLRQSFRSGTTGVQSKLNVERELYISVPARYLAEIAQSARPPLSATVFARGVRAIRDRHSEMKERAAELTKKLDADAILAMLEGRREPHASEEVVEYLTWLRRLVYEAFAARSPEAVVQDVAENVAIIGLVIGGVVAAIATGQVGYASAPLTIYNTVKPKASLYSRTVADHLAERRVRRVEASGVFPQQRWSCGICGALLKEDRPLCLVCGTEHGDGILWRQMMERMRRVVSR